jgi:ornithine cyclodeaminase/alanine dehydrogenase-like protein (mu-crystallin family)
MEAICEALPMEQCLLWDRDRQLADALVAELGGIAVDDLKEAALSADVIACCTTSRQPYLALEMVRPGAFIAAVGADHPDKSEISPALMAAATVVTDVTPQCMKMGDLHHAIDAGEMTATDVHAELGEILVGAKSGRTSAEEIIIFDSTGTGLQDVAAAAAIYERCKSDSSIISIAISAA